MKAKETTPDAPLLADFPAPSYADWRKAAEESLDGASFDKKLVTRTPEGIDLQPIYTREKDGTATPGEARPGEFPYVRGAEAPGAGEASWLICQELPYSDPVQFNAALLQDLNHGQNAINLPCDVATRLGLDPDTVPTDQVGGHGLSLATLDDLVRALRGVDLAAVPLYVTGGVAALPLTAMFVAWLAEQGKAPAVLRGSILSDPYAEWLGQGGLPGGLEAAFDEMAVLTDWAGKSGSALCTVGVQANVWAEAGGSSAHELAYGLATGVDYLRVLAARWVEVNRAGPRFLFTYATGSHFFMEVAKLRAARLLWARAVTAAGGETAAARLVCHVRGSHWNKSLLDPQVNLLRATSEAFAAIVGGCASLHVAPFDETYRGPDDFSRRLARNIQIILGEECQLARVQDAGGGSWYLETLTRQLAEKAWTLFQEIEKDGGMAMAVRAGRPQAAVEKLAAERISAVEHRRDAVIGANLQPNLDEKITAMALSDNREAAARRARLVTDYRALSATDRGAAILGKLAKAQGGAASDRMKLITDAFALGATLGEVTKVLRAGRSGETAIKRLVASCRSEPFENLRLRAEAFRARHGSRPKVFLANLGPRKQHGARADFSRGFFAAGGFEAVMNGGFETPAAAAQAALASAAPIVVICSTDETYPALVPPLAQALKAASAAPIVVLAGLPASDELRAQFKSAGVDEFIHVRANCAGLLARFQDRLGL